LHSSPLGKKLDKKSGGINAEHNQNDAKKVACKYIHRSEPEFTFSEKIQSFEAIRGEGCVCTNKADGDEATPFAWDNGCVKQFNEGADNETTSQVDEQRSPRKNIIRGVVNKC